MTDCQKLSDSESNSSELPGPRSPIFDVDETYDPLDETFDPLQETFDPNFVSMKYIFET